MQIFGGFSKHRLWFTLFIYRFQWRIIRNFRIRVTATFSCFIRSCRRQIISATLERGCHGDTLLCFHDAQSKADGRKNTRKKTHRRCVFFFVRHRVCRCAAAVAKTDCAPNNDGGFPVKKKKKKKKRKEKEIKKRITTTMVKGESPTQQNDSHTHTNDKKRKKQRNKQRPKKRPKNGE